MTSTTDKHPQEEQKKTFRQFLAKAKHISGIDIQGLAYAPGKAAPQNNLVISDDYSMKTAIKLAGEDDFVKDKGVQVQMLVE